LPIDPLNQTKLVRMSRDGVLLPAVLLGHFPVGVFAQSTNSVLAITRIPLLTPGPIYAAGSTGGVLWSNPEAPSSFKGFYPDRACVTTTGDFWVVGVTEGACFCEWPHVRVVRVDPADGHMIDGFDMPYAGQGANHGYAAAAPDGTCWVSITDGLGVSRVYNLDASGILQSFVVSAYYNGTTNTMLVDGSGDLLLLGLISENGGGLIRKVSHVNGSILKQYSLAGPIVGFALGSGGDDLYAVVGLGTPTKRKLVRLNLATGLASSRQTDPPAFATGIGMGDPSGFIYANVVDQNGDNDGDGWTNRQETLARSSPYDPLSRPDGPKVEIRFTQSTTFLFITFTDPDGLVDPVGGLDFRTLSVKAGNYGEIFNLLLSFLTFVTVTPDGKSATAYFFGLPLPANLKLPLDVSVADLTGAVGWDWQVTPPGNL